MRFDHHCPWLGQCIARRNYIYFYLFIVSLNCLCFTLLGFSVAQIVLMTEQNMNNPSIDKTRVIPLALKDCILSIYIIIYILLAMIFVTGLLIYHTYLVVTNQTTKEELKKVFANVYKNPYRRSCCTNIINICCPRISKMSILDIIKINENENKRNKAQTRIHQFDKISNLNHNENEIERVEENENKENNKDNFMIENNDRQEEEHDNQINSSNNLRKPRSLKNNKILNGDIQNGLKDYKSKFRYYEEENILNNKSVDINNNSYNNGQTSNYEVNKENTPRMIFNKNDNNQSTNTNLRTSKIELLIKSIIRADSLYDDSSRSSHQSPSERPEF